MRRKHFISGLAILVVCIASITFMFAPLGHVSLSLATASVSGISAKDYALPKGSDPWGTTMDSHGQVWVAVPGCDPQPVMCGTSTPGNIAVFNVSTLSWANVFSLPSGYAQAFFLKFDNTGNLWFPLPSKNAIGMYNPTSGAFQQWAVPTAAACPWDLAIDSHGAIWFSEFCANQIGRFDPGTHTFMEFATPTSNSSPYGITIDASNNVWFTENNSAVGRIGEYTAQGTFLEYKIRTSPNSSLTPHLITVDSHGNLWWTEGFAGRLGRLKVAQAQPGTKNGVTEYASPQPCQCGTHTSGIGVDSAGSIWFDDSLEGIFGSFPSSGTGSFHAYAAPSGVSGHPHDGLMVDSHNRIWFDEEFANKLALAQHVSTSTLTPTATMTATATNPIGTMTATATNPIGTMTATATKTPKH